MTDVLRPLDLIASAAARASSETVDGLRFGGKRRDIADWRAAAYVVARACGHTLLSIAEFFGGRSNVTVSKAARRATTAPGIVAKAEAIAWHLRKCDDPLGEAPHEAGPVLGSAHRPPRGPQPPESRRRPWADPEIAARRQAMEHRW